MNRTHRDRTLLLGFSLAAAAMLGMAGSLAACSGSGATGAISPLPSPGPSGPTPTPGPTPPMTLSVPAGFHVTMVNTNVPGARFLAYAPNGDLIVSQTDNGTVVAIKPSTAVNAAPQVIASGLPRPHGLAFHGNDLYIATWTGLSVIRSYPTGTLVQTLYSGLAENGDHNNRSLAIAPDGTVFESSGSDCNLCSEGSNLLATVMHMNADGTNPQIYASGVRNGSGLAFDGSGQLWMVVNQRDDLPPNHENLPTEEFDKVVNGGNYGWPSCFPDSTGARQANPDYGTGTQSCAGQQADTFPMQAHSAPLGIVFYNGSMFPSSYKGGAFVAFHGSWDRSVPTGDKVVFITFTSGQPSSIMDFVTGWLQSGSYLGRPVGLAVGADGSLYISDDKLGYVYRITYG
ncbi:MAG TPA: PQQ-dependent sugar dehydrogenase [Candidatus Tumulicola sp.]|nr:PQQ-dependent sugar dehydrogenase [Candidatus Tumulicola sp.]